MMSWGIKTCDLSLWSFKPKSPRIQGLWASGCLGSGQFRTIYFYISFLYLYKCVHVNTCTDVCIYICTHTHTYVYIYI